MATGARDPWPNALYRLRERLSVHLDVRCIPPQVQHINGAELLGHTSPDARIGIAVDPGTVADKGDYALFANPVRGPADGHLVGIIKAVFQCYGANEYLA